MIEWILLLSLIGMIILGMQIKDYKYPSQIQKECIKEFNKEWEQIKMTERFYISGVGISDRERKRLYDLQTVDGFISVRDLLNELSTENRQLKKQIETEHTMLDNAILLERTRMGKNSLQQYKEAIQ